MCQRLVFVFILTASATASAQKTGDKAVLFTFGGLSTLSMNSFQGGLGGKYFVAPEIGIRGTLIFANASEKIPANPTPPDTGTNGSASGSTVGLGVAAEYHLAKGKVSPYVGAGLLYASSKSKSKTAETGNPPGPATSVTNDLGCQDVNGTNFCAGSAFTIAALLGFEYFPWDNVSLAAEYQVGYTSLKRADEKTTGGGNPDLTRKGGSGSTVGVTTLGLLTFAVYF